MSLPCLTDCRLARSRVIRQYLSRWASVQLGHNPTLNIMASSDTEKGHVSTSNNRTEYSPDLEQGRAISTTEGRAHRSGISNPGPMYVRLVSSGVVLMITSLLQGTIRFCLDNVHSLHVQRADPRHRAPQRRRGHGCLCWWAHSIHCRHVGVPSRQRLWCNWCAKIHAPRSIFVNPFLQPSPPTARFGCHMPPSSYQIREYSLRTRIPMSSRARLVFISSPG